MPIRKEFQENKIQVNNCLEETLKAVAQLKHTVFKMQRYECAAQLRVMEKQLGQMKKEIFGLKI